MFASGSVAAYRTRRQRLAIMIDTVVVQQHIRSAILVIDIARVRCNVIICTKKNGKKKSRKDRDVEKGMRKKIETGLVLIYAKDSGDYMEYSA